jgi:hypothetical protein
VTDLLQVMYGLETPVVVQNITESDAQALNGDQPSNVPGLSDLLNLGADPATGPAPADLTAAPTSPPPPAG